MRQLAAFTLVLCSCGGPAARSLVSATQDAGGTVEPMDAGQVAPPPSGPSLAGCPMFLADDPWNRDISAEPLDPHSGDYLAYMGAGSLRLHPDFWGPYGQPFAVVPLLLAERAWPVSLPERSAHPGERGSARHGAGQG